MEFPCKNFRTSLKWSSARCNPRLAALCVGLPRRFRYLRPIDDFINTFRRLCEPGDRELVNARPSLLAYPAIDALS